MKLKGQQINEIVELSYSFEGKEIRVSESLSCMREAGHDRHFATHTHFSFSLERVLATISGAQLIFYSARSQYSVGVDNVVSFEKIENGLEIVEQFEQKTERRTTIEIVNE